MTLHKKALLFVLGTLVYTAVSLAQNMSSLGKKPFTVRDSIEMTTFSDPYTRTPGATAKESPDHSGFLVVTTRGIVSTNQLESSLWLYSTAGLKRYVAGESDHPPSPKLLYQRKGVPEARQTNSYGSLITDVHWSENSRDVYALVEMKGGVHHFVAIHVKHATFEDMTPHTTHDVHSASVVKETIAYLQADPYRLVAAGEAKTGEIVRTGQTIFHILFPERYPDPSPVPLHWVLTLNNGGIGRPRRSDLRVPYPAGAAINFSPVLSPGGDDVITVVSAKSLRRTWASYRAAESKYRFDALPSYTKHSKDLLEWPWQFAIMNTRTGRFRMLLDAPVAWTAGYWNNVTQAAWSPSGDRILFTNTFLPIPTGTTSSPNSIEPCAIATYGLNDRKYDCVSRQHASRPREYLSQAHFDLTGQSIQATWQSSNGPIVTGYTQHASEWVEVPSTPNAVASGLRLVVHQDLTEPPSLWVEDGGTQRLVWNPNPQLASTTLASGRIDHWTDSSGYTWTGALLTPPSPMPVGGYPLVIQTHGLNNQHEFMADGAYTTGFAAQPLACSGIAVLQMEDRSDKQQRGSSSEGDDAVRGILSAIENLHSAGTIDDSKVGIVGFSRTHWYVERALEVAPTQFKAAVLIDGVDQSYVTDVLFAPDWPSYARDHEESIGSHPFGEGLSKWLTQAPGFNTSKIRAAVRLEAISPPSILGEWETYSTLRQLRRPVDLVEIPDGQHILQKPQNRYASQEGVVDWFNFWLEGYERSDAADRTRYQNWEEMRSQLH